MTDQLGQGRLAHVVRVLGVLVGGLAACATDPSVEQAPLTAIIVGQANLGVVEVGTTAPTTLRIEVRQGMAPREGVLVRWSTQSGTMAPATSVTDADGVATAEWTVGTIPGPQRAWAKVAGISPDLAFEASLVAGPAVSVVKLAGDQQVVGAPAVYGLADLRVEAHDRFGNLSPAATFTWSVASGPVELAGVPGSNHPGTSFVAVRGTRLVGTAHVVASVVGTAAQASFTLEIVEGEWMVVISNPSYTSAGLRSLQTNSWAPVDTMPVGATMVFKNQDYWDAINSHRIAPVGVPTFPPCPDLVEWESTCRVTFTAPGTYSYTLVGTDLLPGTIVVLP